MARPSDVAHDPRENTLTITWPDGFASTYPVPYLRAWCPCAGCQGHSSRIAHRPAPDSTTISSLWEVGAYALGLRFGDGHDDGIYTWSWLRTIAFESPPVGRKLGAFDGGVYSGPVEAAVASEAPQQ
ncbi:hypothetical protein ENSA5_41190 [Enhygromyxa salina]|uniref:Gamma-butyrobetaine hydroxylase-like N-terminal domain-containing protein n=1 Tax=Enhygromyxa salina TaxID=215803 RepID=A0A2S9XMQ3_9BACT|nr:DUF971 domain-containing protein [Enhygromyxa salina]PRP94164.1 hypothetical protein ENSA5_41190 [Enhygromyxa salina]